MLKKRFTEDTRVSDLRRFGKHMLTIRYDDYSLENPGPRGLTAAGANKISN